MSLLWEKHVVITRKYVVITRKDVELTRKDLVITTKLSGKNIMCVAEMRHRTTVSIMQVVDQLVNQKYSTTCEVRLQKESVIFSESEYSLIQMNYSNELLIFSKSDS